LKVRLKKLTIQNFFSFGNNEQVLEFDKEGKTIIIGKSTSGLKNGVGKCLDKNTELEVDFLDTATKEKFLSM